MAATWQETLDNIKNSSDKAPLMVELHRIDDVFLSGSHTSNAEYSEKAAITWLDQVLEAGIKHIEANKYVIPYKFQNQPYAANFVLYKYDKGLASTEMQRITKRLTEIEPGDDQKAHVARFRDAVEDSIYYDQYKNEFDSGIEKAFAQTDKGSSSSTSGATRVADDSEWKTKGRRTDKYYQTFSGTDMVAHIVFPNHEGIILGEVSTVTYSIYREKAPVRTLGSINPRGFTKGPRTIAGTLIFTVFQRHIVNRLRREVPYLHDLVKIKPDELPPFDIIISLGNEYGSASWLGIFGITVVDEGKVFSVEDMFTENQWSYMAHDIYLMDCLGHPLMPPVIHQLKTTLENTGFGQETLILDKDFIKMQDQMQAYQKGLDDANTEALRRYKEAQETRINIADVLNAQELLINYGETGIRREYDADNDPFNNRYDEDGNLLGSYNPEQDLRDLLNTYKDQDLSQQVIDKIVKSVRDEFGDEVASDVKSALNDQVRIHDAAGITDGKIDDVIDYIINRTNLEDSYLSPITDEITGGIYRMFSFVLDGDIYIVVNYETANGVNGLGDGYYMRRVIKTGYNGDIHFDYCFTYSQKSSIDNFDSYPGPKGYDTSLSQSNYATMMQRMEMRGEDGTGDAEWMQRNRSAEFALWLTDYYRKLANSTDSQSEKLLDDLNDVTDKDRKEYQLTNKQREAEDRFVANAKTNVANISNNDIDEVIGDILSIIRKITIKPYAASVGRGSATNRYVKTYAVSKAAADEVSIEAGIPFVTVKWDSISGLKTVLGPERGNREVYSISFQRNISGLTTNNEFTGIFGSMNADFFNIGFKLDAEGLLDSLSKYKSNVITKQQLWPMISKVLHATRMQLKIYIDFDVIYKGNSCSGNWSTIAKANGSSSTDDCLTIGTLTETVTFGDVSAILPIAGKKNAVVPTGLIGTLSNLWEELTVNVFNASFVAPVDIVRKSGGQNLGLYQHAGSNTIGAISIGDSTSMVLSWFARYLMMQSGEIPIGSIPSSSDKAKYIADSDIEALCNDGGYVEIRYDFGFATVIPDDVMKQMQALAGSNNSVLQGQSVLVDNYIHTVVIRFNNGGYDYS